MSPADLSHLAALLNRRSGLVIGADRARLIESKLRPVAQRFGFRSCAGMLAELPYPAEELAQAITEAMTVNESSFFRDGAVFEHIRDRVMPALYVTRAQRRRVRIWCAAVSTGQEAYSLAMMLDEMGLAARGWKIDLIATDLSAAAIARAEEGLYTPYEIERGLAPEALIAHFTRDGINWRIAERLRRMVSFRVFNLLDHYGWLGEVDLVLCRNVLMYLDPHSRAQVLRKTAEVLVPDGTLILGEKESAGAEWTGEAVRGVYSPHTALPVERKRA